MKNHVSLLIKTIICILLILSLCGCWNSRELDTLAIVMGAGVDKATDSSKIQVTVQIVKPGEIKSQKNDSGGGSEKAFWNFSSTGDTIFGALRGLTRKSSRKMFFPHNQLLIFGQDIAKDGVQKYIDFYVRDPETRVGVQVMISKGRAEEILDTKSVFEKIPANSIVKMIEVETAATSQTRAIKLRDFITLLMSKTSAAIAPFIEVSEEGDEKVAMISGMAVFKGDKMIGELDKIEGRGLSWVLGEVKSTIIEVEDPSNNKVSMETIRASGKMVPELRNNKIIMKVNIMEEGNIGEQAGPENLSKLPVVALLEKKKEEVIRSEIMAAVKKAKELNADVFGLGDTVHQKYPEQWKELEANWDKIFPNIEVEVNIEAKLRLMGRIIVPTVPPKEQEKK